ncbi:MAG: MotA/TolQ/ExbB proton channel family protein [Oligoflexia bacterium]|nr:MotA/TolQ/ExbB proton channel family protein [Oligoflexia bacterium]
MISKSIELLISGGVVMPFLVLGCLVMWFGLIYRIFILNDRKLVKKYESEIKSCNDSTIVMNEAESEFNKFNQLTSTIVMVAPLLGLLGTVGGMIETFQSLGDMTLFSQSGGIAGGISQALITTQFGLSVAIPGMFIGRVLQKKKSVIMTNLEELAQKERC